MIFLCITKRITLLSIENSETTTSIYTIEAEVNISIYTIDFKVKELFEGVMSNGMEELDESTDKHTNDDG